MHHENSSDAEWASTRTDHRTEQRRHLTESPSAGGSGGRADNRSDDALSLAIEQMRIHIFV
jgi:hypothetical protein